jgi:hypothetical protein
MNINVHIERLILDGLPVKGSDGAVVQAAVERELARLLGERGLTAVSAGAVPRLAVGPIELTRAGEPAHLGHQIARAIHGGIGSPPAPKRSRRSTGGPRA